MTAFAGAASQALGGGGHNSFTLNDLSGGYLAMPRLYFLPGECALPGETPFDQIPEILRNPEILEHSLDLTDSVYAHQCRQIEETLRRIEMLVFRRQQELQNLQQVQAAVLSQRDELQASYNEMTQTWVPALFRASWLSGEEDCLRNLITETQNNAAFFDPGIGEISASIEVLRQSIDGAVEAESERRRHLADAFHHHEASRLAEQQGNAAAAAQFLAQANASIEAATDAREELLACVRAAWDERELEFDGDRIQGLLTQINENLSPLFEDWRKEAEQSRFIRDCGMIAQKVVIVAAAVCLTVVCMPAGAGLAALALAAIKGTALGVGLSAGFNSLRATAGDLTWNECGQEILGDAATCALACAGATLASPIAATSRLQMFMNLGWNGVKAQLPTELYHVACSLHHKCQELSAGDRFSESERLTLFAVHLGQTGLSSAGNLLLSYGTAWTGQWMGNIRGNAFKVFAANGNALTKAPWTIQRVLAGSYKWGFASAIDAMINCSQAYLALRWQANIFGRGLTQKEITQTCLAAGVGTGAGMGTAWVQGRRQRLMNLAADEQQQKLNDYADAANGLNPTGVETENPVLLLGPPKPGDAPHIQRLSNDPALLAEQARLAHHRKLQTEILDQEAVAGQPITKMAQEPVNEALDLIKSLGATMRRGPGFMKAFGNRELHLELERKILADEALLGLVKRGDPLSLSAFKNRVESICDQWLARHRQYLQGPSSDPNRPLPRIVRIAQTVDGIVKLPFRLLNAVRLKIEVGIDAISGFTLNRICGATYRLGCAALNTSTGKFLTWPLCKVADGIAESRFGRGISHFFRETAAGQRIAKAAAYSGKGIAFVAKQIGHCGPPARFFYDLATVKYFHGVIASLPVVYPFVLAPVSSVAHVMVKSYRFSGYLSRKLGFTLANPTDAFIAFRGKAQIEDLITKVTAAGVTDASLLLKLQRTHHALDSMQRATYRGLTRRLLEVTPWALGLTALAALPFNPLLAAGLGAAAVVMRLPRGTRFFSAHDDALLTDLSAIYRSRAGRASGYRIDRLQEVLEVSLLKQLTDSRSSLDDFRKTLAVLYDEKAVNGSIRNQMVSRLLSAASDAPKPAPVDSPASRAYHRRTRDAREPSPQKLPGGKIDERKLEILKSLRDPAEVQRLRETYQGETLYSVFLKYSRAHTVAALFRELDLAEQGRPNDLRGAFDILVQTHGTKDAAKVLALLQSTTGKKAQLASELAYQLFSDQSLRTRLQKLVGHAQRPIDADELKWVVQLTDLTEGPRFTNALLKKTVGQLKKQAGQLKKEGKLQDAAQELKLAADLDALRRSLYRLTPGKNPAAATDASNKSGATAGFSQLPTHRKKAISQKAAAKAGKHPSHEELALLKREPLTPRRAEKRLRQMLEQLSSERQLAELSCLRAYLGAEESKIVSGRVAKFLAQDGSYQSRFRRKFLRLAEQVAKQARHTEIQGIATEQELDKRIADLLAQPMSCPLPHVGFLTRGRMRRLAAEISRLEAEIPAFRNDLRRQDLSDATTALAHTRAELRRLVSLPRTKLQRLIAQQERFREKAEARIAKREIAELKRSDPRYRNLDACRRAVAELTLKMTPHAKPERTFSSWQTFLSAGSTIGLSLGATLITGNPLCMLGVLFAPKAVRAGLFTSAPGQNPIKRGLAWLTGIEPKPGSRFDRFLSILGFERASYLPKNPAAGKTELQRQSLWQTVSGGKPYKKLFVEFDQHGKIVRDANGAPKKSMLVVTDEMVEKLRLATIGKPSEFLEQMLGVGIAYSWWGQIKYQFGWPIKRVFRALAGGGRTAGSGA